MLVFNASQCPVHPETFIALSGIRHLLKMGKIFTEVEFPLLKECSRDALPGKEGLHVLLDRESLPPGPVPRTCWLMVL